MKKPGRFLYGEVLRWADLRPGDYLAWPEAHSGRRSWVVTENNGKEVRGFVRRSILLDVDDDPDRFFRRLALLENDSVDEIPPGPGSSGDLTVVRKIDPRRSK